MKRSILLGIALSGAVLAGVLWHWNETPGTRPLAHEPSGAKPELSVRLLSPGILRIALGSNGTGLAGLALANDGTIVIAASSSQIGGVVLRLTSSGRPANAAITLVADAPS